MRRALAATAAVILAGALISTAPAQARDKQADGPGGVDTSALTDGVTVNEIMKHQRAFQQIANGCDESINTIASRYRYALAKLRERLT